MSNPIVSAMMSQRQNNISSIVNFIKGKSPQEAINMMCSMNPKFKQFYEQNKDVPVEDLCSRYGVNFEDLKNVLR